MIICVGEETNCTEIILFNDGKLSVPVFLSSIETTINIKQRLNNFPVTVFEPWTSGFSSDRYANCAAAN